MNERLWASVTEKTKTIVQGTHNIFTALMLITAETVEKMIQTSGKNGISLIEALDGMIQSTIRGVVEIGGNLGEAIRGLVVGILQGCRRQNVDISPVIHALGTSIIKTTAKLGGDVPTAARALIEGVVEAAERLGFEPRQAVDEAARACGKAAYTMNRALGEKVKEGLNGTIAGIKVNLTEKFYE